MIYQLVESLVALLGSKGVGRACRHRVQRETMTTRRRKGTC